jgi:CheY-like chemotaxis protein
MEDWKVSVGSRKRSMSGSFESDVDIGSVKILVVDDNRANLLVATRLLGKLAGNPPETVDSGEKSVELVREARKAGSPFDVVFMDLHMPTMDGITAARLIRAQEREDGASPVEIVALTADVVGDSREECREAGMEQFLAKPIEVNMVKKVLIAAVTNQVAQPLEKRARVG